jgi:hypothetical protein
MTVRRRILFVEGFGALPANDVGVTHNQNHGLGRAKCKYLSCTKVLSCYVGAVQRKSLKGGLTTWGRRETSFLRVEKRRSLAHCATH